MASTNRAEFKRLMLKIERNLFAQVHLRTLLTALDKAYAEDQQELRAIKTRMKRDIATASGRKADRATAAHGSRVPVQYRSRHKRWSARRKAAD